MLTTVWQILDSQGRPIMESSNKKLMSLERIRISQAFMDQHLPFGHACIGCSEYYHKSFTTLKKELVI
jgi:hypothetical protein